MLLERLSNFNLVDFIVIAFATYRLSVMFVHEWENGPKNILTRFRIWAGWVDPAFGEAYPEEGSLAEGLMCYFCNSIWIGTAFAIIYACLLAAGLPAWLFFLPLAASGASVLVAEVVEADEE